MMVGRGGENHGRGREGDGKRTGGLVMMKCGMVENEKRNNKKSKKQKEVEPKMTFKKRKGREVK